MMKHKLIPALALALVLLLPACSGQKNTPASSHSYEHIDFVSTIEKEDCCLCGSGDALAAYWGQDNLGLVNVNTFKVLPVDINTYDWDGTQIKEAQGVFLAGGGYLGESLVHTFTDPDRGDSHVDIQYVGGSVDPEAIGNYLCKDCLDAFASHYSEDDDPPEVAVVNFTTRELRPLVRTCPWFTFDNFAVSCDFQEDESISLLLYYCPPRFQE